MNLPPPTPPTPAPYYAVTVPKRTRHGFHLTMCLLSFGAWLPVYALAALLNAGKTETRWVAHHPTVHLPTI